MKRIIKKFRIDKRIKVGYGSAFFLLLISYILTLVVNKKSGAQSRLIGHTNSVISKLESFQSLIKDAELGFRGFVLTGDKKMLEPYHQSRTQAGPLFYDLLNEIMPAAEQKHRLQNAKVLMEENFSLTAKAIDVFEKNGRTITVELQNLEKQGQLKQDLLKEVIENMQESERELLVTRTDELENRYSLLNNIVIVSLLFALLLFVFGYFTYVSENRARQIANVRAEEYRQELEERINELNKANKELMEMRRLEKFTATGRIARTIAHEVRNPLTNINLSVDQLKSETDADAETRDAFYEMILRNSRRINTLITSLLDATKFTELNAEKISINDLLEEALLLAGDRLTLNSITIIKSFNNDICKVNVDKEKLKIVFLNIIVNAIEAMEPGEGILTIHTYEQNGKCVVTISDNGCGMDEETLSKLFEPYYSKKAKGTGLGLTNAENIILSHKGSIHVESSPGKGTTFIIALNFA
ncbi:MAG: CHASE3 domain-containing protein [Chitinophagaceae bacterium]|nr:CHASE3 domain-containing protein [Chitinophagaceae bacterium]